ncbi:MAG: hypothetical protein ABS89_01195 [Thiobacillus sp. SCN 63-1177]|nr:MAG: hypothetical protein ABS89_01195 [Thiobacillus sp. SCN 63-1177]
MSGSRAHQAIRWDRYARVTVGRRLEGSWRGRLSVAGGWDCLAAALPERRDRRQMGGWLARLVSADSATASKDVLPQV